MELGTLLVAANLYRHRQPHEVFQQKAGKTFYLSSSKANNLLPSVFGMSRNAPWDVGGGGGGRVLAAKAAVTETIKLGAATKLKFKSLQNLDQRPKEEDRD